ncbi:MAG: hypothetical protein BAJALOKI1v1_10028 [Promethearchaeota archaeon]|nr:MAG: hypothetical protein BAJALOKI1v1_10028 [Candidatus Lokiarchaeota archaeon]
MLFYLSIIYCDIFATFDSTFINEIKGNSEILAWIKYVNPNLRLWMNDLKDKKIVSVE